MQLLTLARIAALFPFSAAQYINLPLHKFTNDLEILQKRQISNGSVILNNQASAYYVNISVGTPPQTVQLVLDTGSPLTWINAQNVSSFTPGKLTSAGSSPGSLCSSNLCLSANASASLIVPLDSVVFDIQYVDGTESVGRTVQDAVTFQGLVDSTFKFGLVQYFYSPQGSSTSLGGVLGLSPPNPVSTFQNLSMALTTTTTTSYFVPETILQQLQTAGAVTNTAFSLYLSDGTTGQLTIGGVDSGRYSGPLTVVPMAQSTAQAGSSFYVTLNSVGFNATTNNQITVDKLFVLDSGTTSTYLPTAVVQQLASNLGGFFVPYDSSSGLLAIPCTLSTTIDFYFANSAVIKVPTNDILAGRLTASQAQKLGISEPTGETCLLSLFGTSRNSSFLLGDAFLRSAYVVFDQAQNQIAIAQAAYNGPSHLTAMGTGQFGIPGGVYNSSSPGASNVALVPSPTKTLTLASGLGIETAAGSATVIFSSLPTTTTVKATEATSKKSDGHKAASQFAHACLAAYALLAISTFIVLV